MFGCYEAYSFINALQRFVGYFGCSVSRPHFAGQDATFQSFIAHQCGEGLLMRVVMVTTMTSWCWLWCGMAAKFFDFKMESTSNPAFLRLLGKYFGLVVNCCCTCLRWVNVQALEHPLFEASIRDKSKEAEGFWGAA